MYLGYIISPCSTSEQGLVRLEEIFNRLQAANLKIKTSKCVLFQKEVRF